MSTDDLLVSIPATAQIGHTTAPSFLQTIGAGTRRILEIMIALTGLIGTSPIILIIAVIIRRDSPGPAIFSQVRVGKGGKRFNFYKFRTLVNDARERFPELYRYDYADEEIQHLIFKRDDDPRVTRVGRWLRKSSLDELPNLWNLLKGDIALVGPRPEIAPMIRYYKTEQLIKFSVKPGLTGLAQISGRGRLRFLETLDYDVEYTKKKSFWFDCGILILTIKAVIRGDGAF